MKRIIMKHAEDVVEKKKLIEIMKQILPSGAFSFTYRPFKQTFIHCHLWRVRVVKIVSGFRYNFESNLVHL